MVLKNVNDVCLESDEPREAEDGELQQPTREERLMKYRNQCKNLVEYLSKNVCPQGLSKNEMRNIKNQAKTHQWDSRSKWFELNVIHLIISTMLN